MVNSPLPAALPTSRGTQTHPPNVSETEIPIIISFSEFDIAEPTENTGKTKKGWSFRLAFFALATVAFVSALDATSLSIALPVCCKPERRYRIVRTAQCQTLIFTFMARLSPRTLEEQLWSLSLPVFRFF